MKRALALALIAAMVVGALPTPAQAKPGQATSGTINGKASDRRGEPLGVCNVRLRNVATGNLVQTVGTDSAGQFAFNNVPIGDYIVEIVDSAGKLIATSAPVTITSSGPVVTGVSVVSPEEVHQGCVAAVLLPTEQGRFFTSTAGIVVLVAAAAGATGGIIAYKKHSKKK